MSLKEACDMEEINENKSGIPVFTAAVLCVLSLAVMSAFPASAQQAPTPFVLTNPQVNGPVHFDISPAIRNLAKQVPVQSGSQLIHSPLKPKLQKLTAAATFAPGSAPDAALQTSMGPLVSATVGLNLSGVSINGPNLDCGAVIGFLLAPSDDNLAVGDTQVVQWVNVCYAVFDKKTGAVIAGPIAGNQFWAGFGGRCETENDGDIIVQWDKVAHRWLMSQNVFSFPYLTCVAVSTTSDATGSFFRYAFPQSNGFPDYPKWGVWTDAYYQHNNVFGGPNGFGSEPCAYDRAKMLKGDRNAKQICFFAPTIFDDGMLPADIDSASTLPAKGQPEVYLGSIDNTPPTSNVIYEYLFHVDFANPSKSTFTGFGGTMPVSVPIFTLSCGGTAGNCIPQPHVGTLLESLGDRLMYRLAYRNFGDHQTWLVSHNVTTAGGQVGERWYEFRAPEASSALSVYQSGTFAGPLGDTNNRWMGSIAMDKAGDIALGYSISSRLVFPSINYAGQTAGDPLGTMESEAIILNGTGSQKDTGGRWGDYTSMALDGADDCTFWYTNQYYTTTAAFSWSTQLASLKFPNCQ
jgi:hypothetical protein